MKKEIEIKELGDELTRIYMSMPHPINEEGLGRENGIKFYIYPNDHQPPHFHAIGNNIDVCCDVNTGEIILGDAGRSVRKIVNNFYQKNSTKIINYANQFFG